MSNYRFKYFALIIGVMLLMGCAGSKQKPVVQVAAPTADRADESFDPLSLNDDDITFDASQKMMLVPPPPTLPLQESPEAETLALPNKLVEGYRIQILSTKELESATRAKAMAMEQFTDLRAKFYLEFDSPYYKVRVGDFQARNDAEEIRSLVRSRGYPQAWIVKTKVWSNPEFPVAEDSTIVNSPD